MIHYARVKVNVSKIFFWRKVFRVTVILAGLEIHALLVIHQTYNKNHTTKSYTLMIYLMHVFFVGDPCFYGEHSCLNQGTCVIDRQEWAPYCLCTKLYKGISCEILKSCVVFPSPCHNGAQCLELEGYGNFRCDNCPSKYYGARCQWSKDAISTLFQNLVLVGHVIML